MHGQIAIRAEIWPCSRRGFASGTSERSERLWQGLGEQLAHSRKPVVRQLYHAGASVLKGRFVFRDGTFLALAFIVGEKVAHALLVPARRDLILRLHRPFLCWGPWYAVGRGARSRLRQRRYSGSGSGRDDTEVSARAHDPAQLRRRFRSRSPRPSLTPPRPVASRKSWATRPAACWPAPPAARGARGGRWRW